MRPRDRLLSPPSRNHGLLSKREPRREHTCAAAMDSCESPSVAAGSDAIGLGWECRYVVVVDGAARWELRLGEKHVGRRVAMTS
jgi:hypothetical protein